MTPRGLPALPLPFIEPFTYTVLIPPPPEKAVVEVEPSAQWMP